MEHAQFQFSQGVGYRDGKQAGVLVIHIAKFNAAPMRIGRQAETLPMEKVHRLGEGDPWALK
jgi:hypothetical protein